jgi:hypothetical protein
VGTDGKKIVNWIDTSNQLTAKKSTRSIVVVRIKILSQWIDTIGQKENFLPMIDTIGQTSNIFNYWIHTISVKHDRWNDTNSVKHDQ